MVYIALKLDDVSGKVWNFESSHVTRLKEDKNFVDLYLFGDTNVPKDKNELLFLMTQIFIVKSKQFRQEYFIKVAKLPCGWAMGKYIF